MDTLKSFTRTKFTYPLGFGKRKFKAKFKSIKSLVKSLKKPKGLRIKKIRF